MKKIILFTGVLFCMLFTMQSYAQKTTKEKKENKIETKRAQKIKSPVMQEVTPRQMEQVNPNVKAPLEVIDTRERVTHRPIDPITGEERPASPLPINENDISITYPSDGSYIDNSILIQGETQKNNRVLVTVTDQDDQTFKKTMYTDSDNNGKWEVRFTAHVTSAMKHIYKITAHRIHSERGNTAIVTVTRPAPPRHLGAASSSGKGN